MKRIFLIALCLLTYTISRAQGVTDTHPDAQIFAIDYQNGQEYPATTDQAILFKDAFIELVRNTAQSRQTLRFAPGRKTALIKQINPEKLNGYQLTWETSILGQRQQVCTFYYNIDENALYFYNQGSQNWDPVQISQENQYNLDNCRATCRFNGPDMSANGGGPLPDLSALPDTTGEAIDADVTTNEAPPALPEYDQPECPADGYMWQPGYWAWSPVAADYYWVPGVWVAPPAVDLYWTPGYWGYIGGIYRFHVGYWGHAVGFYGGINYGYGYVGVGYVGGQWRSGRFAYNTAVVHVNTVVIHNTYVNRTVINNTTIINNRTSFNGQGGVTARPTATEQVAMRDHHIMPTRDQIIHQQAALGNRDQFAKDNNGRPTFTSMQKVQPAVLNKGTGPAVNNNNHNFNRPNGNNTPNNQGSRPFGNNPQQPANNGQQNNGFNRDNRNPSNPNQQQPANNGQQNNGFNRDNRNPSNPNQQQPANNGQQNNGFNRDNRNPSNPNQQQPANNGQQNNGVNRDNHNPSNPNQQQPANNGQQNNGFNRDNHNPSNPNQQQPANNGQQNNGFNRGNHTPTTNNQQPAVNGNQLNRNPNNGQQQPANNGQQNNNRANPSFGNGNKTQNNKPATEQHQHVVKPSPKSDKGDQQ